MVKAVGQLSYLQCWSPQARWNLDAIAEASEEG